MAVMDAIDIALREILPGCKREFCCISSEHQELHFLNRNVGDLSGRLKKRISELLFIDINDVTSSTVTKLMSVAS